MGKIAILSLTALMLSLTAAAQDKKIAIFDPAGNVDNIIKDIVREEISSGIVNTGSYIVLERQLISKVLEENKFQLGGLADDLQVSEMGGHMGANLVFVSNVSLMSNGNYYISCKIIDVFTARIDRQKTAQTQRGTDDLLSVVQATVEGMLKDMPTARRGSSTNAFMANAKDDSDEDLERMRAKFALQRNMLTDGGMLTAYGRTVYQNGKELSQDEVRQLMAGTDLELYNQGIRRNKSGNFLLGFGIGALSLGVLIYAAQDAENTYGSSSDYSSSYSGSSSEGGNVNVGALLIVAGIGMTIPGIIMKTTSRNPVGEAVDAYNRRAASRVSMELKFGATRNGVGLALKF